MKKVSMKDIAKELNTSITTVSFVINGKSEEMGISPVTAKKVRDLIKKRGFNPNSAARILRTGKSKTIGLTSLKCYNTKASVLFCHVLVHNKQIDIDLERNAILMKIFFSPLSTNMQAC